MAGNQDFELLLLLKSFVILGLIFEAASVSSFGLNTRAITQVYDKFIDKYCKCRNDNLFNLI